MAEHKELPDVTVIETGGSSGLKWFAVGALIGAGLGLLFAPQSGERTRRNLARRARKLRDVAEEKFEQISEEVEGRGRKLKETVEEWADEFTDEVRAGSRKVERAVERTAGDAREELERRLSSARARRRAAVAADGVAEDDEADD